MINLCKSTGHSNKEHAQVGEIPISEFEDDDEVTSPIIPRFLQLARSIHARFTAKEEKELAALREAQARAARKNEVIMRAVQEVLDFCELLRTIPELNAALDQKTEDITERYFSTGCSFTVEHETIVVQYAAPEYHVDMHVPDRIRLTSADNAYLHISFNPVKFVVVNQEAEGEPTVTKHLLIKQYRLDANGTFFHLQSHNSAPADPIADIITELRAKLGGEFFETILLPYFETQGKSPH